MPDEELIAIAHILRPQGRKGEVLAEMLTDLEEQFAAERTVHLAKAANAPAKGYVLQEHWLPVGKNAGRIVLKFAGVESISEAEALAKLDVLVPVSELPALEDDTFYVRDLVGCTLLNGDARVGEIVDLQFATSPDGKVRLEDAPPLLEVEDSPDEEHMLVPFAKAYLVQVDIAAKQVVMDLPDGLLDEVTKSDDEE